MTLTKAIQLLGLGRVIEIDYRNMWNNPDFAFSGKHRVVIFLVGGSYSKLRPNGRKGLTTAIRAYDYVPQRSLSNQSGWKKFLLSEITSFKELNFNIKTPPPLYSKNDKGMRTIYAAR